MVIRLTLDHLKARKVKPEFSRHHSITKLKAACPVINYEGGGARKTGAGGGGLNNDCGWHSLWGGRLPGKQMAESCPWDPHSPLPEGLPGIWC